MNERQKEIASQAIAQIVADAADSPAGKSDADLSVLAVNAAKAMAAAFAELDHNLEQFPSLDDGPPKRSWRPAIPAHAGKCSQTNPSHCFKFSVQTEDGTTHRFLMTRQGMAWMAMAMVLALSPGLERLSGWWFRRQLRIASQSPMSSGKPSVDGSPQEGNAE